MPQSDKSTSEFSFVESIISPVFYDVIREERIFLALPGKDVGYVLIGLAVCIAPAVAINPKIEAEILAIFSS